MVQLPSLLSWGVTGPMDEDPFTIETAAWLATVAGDTLVSATPVVFNADGSSQSDVTVVAVTLNGPSGAVGTSEATAWLTGGAIGKNYIVTWDLITSAGRNDRKSVSLYCVAARS